MAPFLFEISEATPFSWVPFWALGGFRYFIQYEWGFVQPGVQTVKHFKAVINFLAL
jgi:hypothetical protein